MNCIYRELTQADIGAVSNLMLLLQDNQSKFDKEATVNGPNKFMLETTLYGVLEDIQQSIYVTIVNDRIVGFLFGWINKERTSYFPLENYLYLSDSYILDDYRDKGHYIQMLKRMEAWARENDCIHCVFEAYTENAPILEIMQKNGYFLYKIRYYKELG